jgi:hypothetical protein
VLDWDRDGVFQEDAPRDLNSDRVLLAMAVPAGFRFQGTHLLDGDNPGFLREPLKGKGEIGTHAILPESSDIDDDGAYGEDGPGGVDLDCNFMHMWPEHQRDAGAFPLSEPESFALATFVLTHTNIAVALTYGRHDNLVSTPDSSKGTSNPKVPVSLSKEDKELYQGLGELYRETTNLKRAPKVDHAGSFFAWAYAQRGIISLATPNWGRPDAPSSGDKPQKEGGKEPGEDPEPQNPSKKEKRKTTGDSDLDEELAWVDYATIRGGGFVPFAPFEHAQLGAVLLGGFHPGFKLNPPSSELDGIATSELAFLTAVIGKRAKVDVIGPEMNAIGEGLFKVDLGLQNIGSLPTTTDLGRQARPVVSLVVRLEVPPDRVLSGNLVEQTWRLEPGERRDLSWIVQVADMENLIIALLDDRLGDRTITIPCKNKSQAVIASRGKELR